MFGEISPKIRNFFTQQPPSSLLAFDANGRLTSNTSLLSPTFRGLTLNGATLAMSGVVSNGISISSSTGANNSADVDLIRFDLANGSNNIGYWTGGTQEWSVGSRAGSQNYVIYDTVNSVAQVTFAQGSGTSGISTFAGNVNISGLTASALVSTDSSKNLISGSLTGDVTTSNLAATIAANVVTYAKFQQVAASSLVGNATGSLANATGIALGTSLTFSGSTINAIQGIRTADSPTFTGLTLTGTFSAASQPNAQYLAASGTQSISNSSVQINVTYFSSHSTNGSGITLATVGNTSFTVTNAGVYQVNAGIRASSGTAQSWIQQSTLSGRRWGWNATESAQTDLSATLTLAANEVVTLWTFSNAGATLGDGGGSVNAAYFNIFRLY